MKKRLLMVLTAVTLILGSTMTAFAQPSVGAEPVVEVETALDKNGESVDIRVEALVGEELQMAQDIVKPENLETVLAESDAEKAWNVFMLDAFVVDDDENEIHWTNIEDRFPVTITFSVPGVTPESNVRVLHYYENWHQESLVDVGTDEITVTFAHLSPVVVLVNNEAASDTTDAPSSPQTGESSVVLYAALIAAIALAGVVVTKRKTN